MQWYAASVLALGVVPAVNEPLFVDPPKVHVCATDVGALDGDELGDPLGEVLGEVLGDVLGEELADALALGAVVLGVEPCWCRRILRR